MFVVTDLQPVAAYVAEGEAVQLNCSVMTSCSASQPLNLSEMVMRRRSTGAPVSGRVQLLADDVAQFTFDRAAQLSDAGNVYCSLDNVTGNTTVDSPPTHIYVLSQYRTEILRRITAEIVIHTTGLKVRSHRMRCVAVPRATTTQRNATNTLSLFNVFDYCVAAATQRDASGMNELLRRDAAYWYVTAKTTQRTVRHRNAPQ